MGHFLRPPQVLISDDCLSIPKGAMEYLPSLVLHVKCVHHMLKNMSRNLSSCVPETGEILASHLTTLLTCKNAVTFIKAKQALERLCCTVSGY